MSITVYNNSDIHISNHSFTGGTSVFLLNSSDVGAEDRLEILQFRISLGTGGGTIELGFGDDVGSLSNFDEKRYSEKLTGNIAGGLGLCSISSSVAGYGIILEVSQSVSVEGYVKYQVC